jgi:hypothetical protein
MILCFLLFTSEVAFSIYTMLVMLIYFGKPQIKETVDLAVATEYN